MFNFKKGATFILHDYLRPQAACSSNSAMLQFYSNAEDNKVLFDSRAFQCTALLPVFDVGMVYLINY